MSDLWVVRDAVPEDEAYIVPTWIKQLVKGDEAKGARGRGASPSWSDEEFCAFYATMHPIIEGVLRSGVRVRVACDPDRATWVAGRRAIVYAWSVTDGDILYGVGVDKPYKPEFGPDLLLAVLGDAHKRPMRMRLDIVDMKPPPIWTRERGWSASLRKASEQKLASDGVHARILQHIHDPKRVAWKPREKRAA